MKREERGKREKTIENAALQTESQTFGCTTNTNAHNKSITHPGLRTT